MCRFPRDCFSFGLCSIACSVLSPFVPSLRSPPRGTHGDRDRGIEEGDVITKQRRYAYRETDAERRTHRGREDGVAERRNHSDEQKMQSRIQANGRTQRDNNSRGPSSCITQVGFCVLALDDLHGARRDNQIRPLRRSLDTMDT